MSLAPGTQLGPYTIEGPLGQGGMGEVYRATDTRLGRPVAIKVSSKEFNDRFEREARAISALNHPHVCTLYDVGPNYLVMEFVEGETFAKLLKQSAIPLDKVLVYAMQIADALAAAHAKGITHRDLKPGNVMLTRNGVKVLDFGLAKLTAVTLSSTSNADEVATLTAPLTGKGAIMGTLQYMSPEQVEGREADARSDIFAFGALIYEMVSAQRAFQGESPASTMAAILKDQPVPLNQLLPATPRALDRAIRKCLEKKPADRWQSAQDLKSALELIDLDATQVSVATSSAAAAATPISSGTIPATQPRSWLLPAVAGIAVAAIAGLTYTVWPHQRAAERVTRFEVPMPEAAILEAGDVYLRVSPDGTKLAFTSGGPLGGIWIRDLDSVEAHLLPGTAGAVAPMWSPDSRSLAYGVSNRLMRVELAGVPPRQIAESTGQVRSGFWTAGGEIVFGPGSIRRVSQSGGVPVPVTVPGPGEPAHTLPFLLPDERHFLYRRGGDLYSGSLDTRPEDQSREKIVAAPFGVEFVRDGDSADGNLFFLNNGTLMAQHFDTKAMKLTGDPIPVAQDVANGPQHGHFSVTKGGVLAYRTRRQGSQRQLSWVDRKGNPLKTIGDPRSLQGFSLSSDGARIILFRSETGSGLQGDLWTLDLDRDIETRVTFGQSVNVYGPAARPVWSMDGTQIAYQSGLQGKMFVKPASGAGEPVALPVLGEPIFWAKDLLLYFQTARGIFALPTTPSFGEGAEVLPPNSSNAVVSTDGRWVAYDSSVSGRNEIYIEPFRRPGQTGPSAGAAKWQVSRDGGARPRWRADGKELFFFAPRPGGGAIMSAQLEIAGDVVRPAAPLQMFETRVSSSSQWDVSGDGKKILTAVPLDREAAAPITVVMNWQSALKR
ncbi:MAG: protein kinase [Acidobacteriota bacterium]